MQQQTSNSNATQGATVAPTQPAAQPKAAAKVRRHAVAITGKTANLLRYLQRHGYTKAAGKYCPRKTLQHCNGNGGRNFGAKGYAAWLGTLAKPATGTVAGMGLVHQLPHSSGGVAITPHGQQVLAFYNTLHK